MGMLLMVIGAICFITGFVFYSTSKKVTDTANQFVEKDNTIYPSTDVGRVPPPASIAATDNSSSSFNSSNSSPNSNELGRIIDMAIADGVLTPNERNLIKEITKSSGLDYNVVIKDVEKRIAESGTSETEIIDVNKKSGDDFEKYVVQKFDRKFFKIKEWAGDKYVNGRYAQTTQHPDLLLEHSHKGKTSEFAVECKWRSSLYNDGVIIANSEQLKRYNDFEKNRQIPVFIVIGVGGKASTPDNLYVVPLKIINSNFISLKFLERYKKQIDKGFYFYSDSQKLM